MKYVSIVDAKEQLSDLIKFLHDKVRLIFNNKPIVKMTPITEELPTVEEKPKPIRRAGIAKDKFTFDDELFDSLDADMTKCFSGRQRRRETFCRGAQVD